MYARPARARLPQSELGKGNTLSHKYCRRSWSLLMPHRQLTQCPLAAAALLPIHPMMPVAATRAHTHIRTVHSFKACSTIGGFVRNQSIILPHEVCRWGFFWGIAIQLDPSLAHCTHQLHNPVHQAVIESMPQQSALHIGKSAWLCHTYGISGELGQL